MISKLNKRVALITGIIPSKTLFEYILHNYWLMLRVGHLDEVIVSTWSADLAVNAEIIEKYSKLFTIIDNGDYLGFRSYGNFFDQMVTLNSALACVPDDAYVLKSRSDVILVNWNQWVPQIFDLLINNTPIDNILRTKVWVPFAHPLHPFFICDIVYAGLSKDIKKFVNFDAEFDVLGTQTPMHSSSEQHVPAALPEYQFWSHAFSTRYPILNEYKAILPFSLIGNHKFQAVMQMNLESQFYWEYLALYWMVLDRYFFSAPSDLLLAQSIEQDGTVYVRDSYKFSKDDGFPDRLINNVPAKYPERIYDFEPLSAFVNGRINTSDYINLFRDAVARALTFECHQNRILEFRDYNTKLRKKCFGP